MAKRELTITTMGHAYQFILRIDSALDEVRPAIRQARDLHQRGAGQLTQEQRRKLVQLYSSLQKAEGLMDELRNNLGAELYDAVEDGRFNPINEPSRY